MYSPLCNSSLFHAPSLHICALCDVKNLAAAPHFRNTASKQQAVLPVEVSNHIYSLHLQKYID